MSPAYLQGVREHCGKVEVNYDHYQAIWRWPEFGFKRGVDGYG